MNFLKPIRLPDGRTTLNLGFGCVGLLRIPLPFQRTQLLRTAVELGITHFDVARMYGLGAAEGVMGNALRPFRERVTLATKFGIPREVPNPLVVNLKYGARWLLSLKPGALKKAKHQTAPAKSSGGSRNFSLPELEKSLSTSLEQLKAERIDLLFLHEPRVGDALPETLGAALQAKVQAGIIGAFGVSGFMRDVDYFTKECSDICGDAVQYNYSVLADRTSDLPRRTFTGMFRVLEGTLPLFAQALANDEALAKTWSDRLNLDLNQPENLGPVILATSLTLNPAGMVIFSTTRPGRLHKTVARLADNSFTTENLLAFRDAVSRKFTDAD